MTFPECQFYKFSAIVIGIGLILLALHLPTRPTGSQLLIWLLLPVGVVVVISHFIIRGDNCPQGLNAIGLIALFLRLGLGLYMYSQVLDSGEFGSLFTKDDRSFFYIGTIVAETWTIGGAPVPITLTSTEAGNIYLNAVAVFLLGPDPRNVVVIQSILGALTVFLLFLMARQFTSERLSMLASFILAIYPPQVYLAAANQRDVVIVLLTELIALVFFQWKENRPFNKLKSVFPLIGAMVFLSFWRIYNALILIPVIIGWVYFCHRRLRLLRSLQWLLILAVFIGVLVNTNLISKQRMAITEALFGQAQVGEFDKLEGANTFGFLANARGMKRFLYLPITLPLSLIFGFGKYQNLPNNDLQALGVLWLWTPLIFPMVLGTRHILRHGWKEHFLLWSIPFAILLMCALGYLGLVTRYRAAAEPFLIVIAMMGLSYMRRFLGLYIVSMSFFCLLLNIFVWLADSRIIVKCAMGLAFLMVLFILAKPALRRIIRRLSLMRQ